jgi:hypothetical protein
VLCGGVSGCTRLERRRLGLRLERRRLGLRLERRLGLGLERRLGLRLEPWKPYGTFFMMKMVPT